jgi:hypothetical protein
MTIIPTLEGGLRIDTEDASDWDLFRSLIADAGSFRVDLADRLGGLIDKDSGGEDWREYVVPDLREEFQDQLAQIYALIESAAHEAEGGAGPLWLRAEHGYAWYGSFNQARLALNEKHQFQLFKEDDSLVPTPEQLAAYARFRFYGKIQNELLQHVLR